MPRAYQNFIIDSMLLESSMCLMLLFKGCLSTYVSHSSKLLTLHVVHTLSLSQNHMNLQSYCTPWSSFPHWQVTLNPIVDISSLVTDWVVSLVLDNKKSIHTLGFVQCLGCHYPYWWLLGPRYDHFYDGYHTLLPHVHMCFSYFKGAF